MATVTLLSVEEYLQVPEREDERSDELINGEIVLSPSAKPLHAKIVRRLIKLLEPLEMRGYQLRPISAAYLESTRYQTPIWPPLVTSAGIMSKRRSIYTALPSWSWKFFLLEIEKG
jgi:hypothetical protein